MGFDIVMYGRLSERLGVIEISYSLHEAIYLKTSEWESYQFLRELKDYYKTDVTFDRSGINGFLFDLEQMKPLIHQRREELDILISSLSDLYVEQIHVASD
ncbi:hypothetical protein [Paenibacillus radicis (ex Xue et al. 2023)]|uniref:Uncharacterized protein n=1 Tax=Paenibacillus radicis (ex Xue et al. 2023) TaxID=2972489 RepID=A0ABT1YG03_9BACL|nr:hypothetical protein [Paenibacillus radicis (ex Xue et al. 2023)]MCR8630885.1 hypothetical protein [Paenibacillus radicis (ex Xue et al. 2023)]